MIGWHASRALDQHSSNRFDIADRFGARLMMLGQMCSEGNGYAAWLAYRLCRSAGCALPDWLTAYLDGAAAFLLDEYNRGEKRDRQIEVKLGLNAPQEHRIDLLRATSPREWMQVAVEALLPGIVDDHMAQHSLPAQTAIKQLARTFGYPGEQWTRFRDAYKRAKARHESVALVD